MLKELCPVCKHHTYEEEEGRYYPDGMKIEPNEGYCSYCGFGYSEHINHPMEEQVERYIKWLKQISDTYEKIRKEINKEVT